jgi:hypothetical protein
MSDDILWDRVDALERVLVRLVREIRAHKALPDEVIRDALESAFDTDNDGEQDEVLHLWQEMALDTEQTPVRT